MSMFDVVFPDPQRHERMGLVMALIAFDTDSPEQAEAYMKPVMQLRLRDVWIEKQPDGPPVAAFYTRNGGGNREHYHDGDSHCTGCHGEAATRHPRYLRDEDDEFDTTYRTYWFSFPDTLPSDVMRSLDGVAEDPRDMSASWLNAIERLGERLSDG